MRTKFSGILTLLLAFVVQIGFAQQKTISGTVTDDSGLPLPGVNVLIKNTSSGTQTDFDGNYSISANQGDILEFSYVGFTSQEIKVGASNNISVSLKAGEALEEVIVTGYGTSTKRSFTGTATKIDAENIERKNVADVSQALSGEVAGVRVINTSGQPGESARIQIRGIGSVNGNTAPLYIVDGVPFNGNISAINPADIASTTVLKDAQATAIYGSRGANGVILINTKKGKSGRGNIEIETKTGVNVNLLPRYDVITSPEQYIGLGWEGLYNSAVIGGANHDAAIGYANDNLFGRAGISAKYNMWNVANGGELIDPETGMVRPNVTRKYNPENWEDHAFQASNRQETNLKISGGSDNSSYYASFGYLDDEGYSLKSDYERFSTRLNINHDITDWLSGTANIGYTKSEQNTGGQSSDSGSIFWFVDNIPSIYPLFLRDENGDKVADPVFGGYQYDYGEGRGFGALTNAIADTRYDIKNRNTHEINTNVFFDVTFTDYLSFETRFGTQYYNSAYNDMNNPFYGSSASSGGSIYKTKTELFTYNFLQLLRFNKSFGDHTIEALAAHESNKYERNYLSAYKNDIVLQNVPEFNNAVVQSAPASSYKLEYALESYFAQVNYDYDDKYFLSGTIRRDGSSRFLGDNKWGTFGALGAAWMITNENFMSNQGIFNTLKLKGSYGLIGEQGGFVDADGTPEIYSYYPGYNVNNINNLGNQLALTPGSRGNKDLTWETSKMWQIGVEMRLFDRVNLDVDYYNKRTEDLLFKMRTAPSQGYAIFNVNDGEILNQGIEFNLGAELVKTQDFKLNLNINGEMFSNEMKSLPFDPSTNAEKIIDVQGAYAYSRGHSIYDYYLREWAGVDPETGAGQWNQYYHDTNGNGQVDEGEGIASLTKWQKDNPDIANQVSKTTTTQYSNATTKYVGKSALPDIRGAFNLSAQYKRFSVSAQFLYSIGGYAYDNVYAGLMSMRGQIGGNNYHKDILNRWQEPGDITDIPRISSNSASDANLSSSSTRFLTKADYLSLNNIRINYDVNPDYFKNIGLAQLSIFASGDNLWLATKRDGFNPSTSISGSSSSYRYSPLSTFTIGVRAKF
ncbi:MAG: SusC/RagA family TonB-linked outer membrane protein [Mesonia hippocampi]|uniref:SusC/RagA family TonB-linked outer membrane protein n=1 Tax=Mesonia hippocampi TaxID=1628250 RepID=UPI003F99E3C0